MVPERDLFLEKGHFTTKTDLKGTVFIKKIGNFYKKKGPKRGNMKSKYNDMEALPYVGSCWNCIHCDDAESYHHAT